MIETFPDSRLSKKKHIQIKGLHLIIYFSVTLKFGRTIQ